VELNDSTERNVAIEEIAMLVEASGLDVLTLIISSTKIPHFYIPLAIHSDFATHHFSINFTMFSRIHDVIPG
jgi:hypothetical protein